MRTTIPIAIRFIVLLLLATLVHSCIYRYSRKIDPKTIQVVDETGKALSGAKLQLFRNDLYQADSQGNIAIKEYRSGSFQFVMRESRDAMEALACSQRKETYYLGEFNRLSGRNQAITSDFLPSHIILLSEKQFLKECRKENRADSCDSQAAKLKKVCHIKTANTTIE